ncbi:ABC transporter substrate-binding protein [Halalkaliarchaeum desulfuricum]|nr:ABC transporter substrate-binding protein [Halalkaliarchaeum desulfuricum]
MSQKDERTVRRRNVLRIGAGITALTLAGCLEDAEPADGEADPDDGSDGTDGEDASEEPRDGGELIFAQQQTPLQLDPIEINDIYSQQIASQLYEPLFDFDEGTEPVPKMAAELPTVERDGERYIVELRDGPRFHNDEPVTATDVKHSLEAPLEEETANAADVEMIESIDLVDEQTVQIDLEFGYGPFFTLVLTRNIVPRDARIEDRTAFNNETPIGSGPYELVDWTEGEFVELQRWDDYWDELPYAERLRFEPIEEQTTRVTVLETGDVDVIGGIPPQLWETVENNQQATIDDAPGISYFYLAFNTNEGPAADPQVREAIDYVFSMDQAVENFVEPAGVRNYGPVPVPVAETWDFPTDQWAQIPHDRDLDRAADLLEDAGVSEDYEFTILTPPDDIREQIGVSVGNGLEEIGYSAQVQRLDWGTFTDTYNTGNEDDCNMYTLGWLGGPDPDNYVYNLFHESQEGSTNGVYYRDGDLMEQILEARRGGSIEERRPLYESAIETILDERLHLPAYSLSVSLGIRDRVNDLVAHPREQRNPRMVSDYNNVWLDE